MTFDMENSPKYKGVTVNGYLTFLPGANLTFNASIFSSEQENSTSEPKKVHTQVMFLLNSWEREIVMPLPMTPQ